MTKKRKQRQRHTSIASNDSAQTEGGETISLEFDIYSNDDERENRTGKRKCSHVNKVKIPHLKKCLLNLKQLNCVTCVATDIKEPVSGDVSPREDLCICLHCGKPHCVARNHAHDHVQFARSHVHSYSFGNRETWCHTCGSKVFTNLPKQQHVAECENMVTTAAKRLDDAAASPGLQGSTVERYTVPPLKLIEKPSSGSPERDEVSKTAATKSEDASVKRGNDTVATRRRGRGPSAVTGFSNLGNTCFFNSVMQALCWSDVLATQLELHSSHLATPLAQELLQLVTSARSSSTRTSPRGLFMAVSKRWRQYKAMRQQDSHEYLRFLLDGVRDDEIKTYRVHYVDQQHQREKPRKTAVDSSFGGKLASILVCDSCKLVSLSYEPYFDLSLPLSLSNTAELSESQGAAAQRNHTLSRKEQRNDKRLKNTEEIASAPNEKILFTPDASPSNSPSASDTRLRLIERILRQDAKTDSADPSSEDDSLSLEKSLRKFVNVDVLEGDNSFFCKRCSVSTKSDKGTTPQDVVSKLGRRLSTLELEQEVKTAMESAEVPKESESDRNAHEAPAANARSEERAETDGLATGEANGETKAAELPELKDTAMEKDPSKNPIDASDPLDTNDETSHNQLPRNDCTTEDLVDAEMPEKAVKPLGGRKSLQPKKKSAPPTALRRAFKRYLIADLPPSVVFHLKRFEVTANGRARKVTNVVNFDEWIDFSDLGVTIDPDLLNEATRAARDDDREVSLAEAGRKGESSAERDESEKEKEGSEEETPEEASGGDEVVGSRSTRYRLYAVVVHHGRISGGHYIAYVRAGKRPEEGASNGTTAATEAPEGVDDNMNECASKPDGETSIVNSSLDDSTFKNNAEASRSSSPHPPPPPGPGTWYYASDESVHPTSIDQVLASEAYLLFYERMP